MPRVPIMRRPRLTGSALTPVAALLLVGCGAATPPSPPEPLAPKPKSVPTCTPPLVASTGLTKDVTVDMTTTLPATGMVTGKTVTLNGPLKLSRSLTVVADGDV